MRRFATTAFLAVLAAAPAMAESPSSQVSVDDYVKAIRAAPAPSAATAVPASAPQGNGSAQAPCAAGQALDGNGLCAPVVHGRGFSLATSSSTAPAHAVTHQRSAATAVASASPRHAMAPPRGSRLSDLLITFRVGSSDITAQGRANASAFAAALKTPSVADVRFEIAGHTDATGAAQRNQELSQARAEAVKAFLVAQGVDGSRLEAHGYGSTEPAEPGKLDAAANRRVEARRLN